MKRNLFPVCGTALLAGTLAVRVLRLLGSWESVRRFYPGGQGPVWALLGMALFFGPYLAAGSAIAALWLPREGAVKLGTVSFCAAAFFTFAEGLTVFARAMNASSGYVGAEPAFSAAAAVISAATLFRAPRAERHGSSSNEQRGT